MNPNYVNTITIYRNKNGAWSRTVLHNCFWKSEIKTVQDGTNAKQTNTYTVRIPLREAESGFRASANDIVILGEATEEMTGKSPNTATEILQRYKPNSFKVSAFADNTSHLMDKHYRLGG